MANYSTLKAAVADVVKTNGTQAITGANLQAVLLSIINSVGGGGYIFKGVATPSTDAGTPDENVFYIGGAGTYANFGTSVTVPIGSIGVFKYNGSWTKETITMFAGIDDVPTAGSNNLITSGYVYQLSQKVGGFTFYVGGTHAYKMQAGKSYLITNNETFQVNVYGRVSENSENITIKAPMGGKESVKYTPSVDVNYIRFTGAQQITNGITIYNMSDSDVLIENNDKIKEMMTSNIIDGIIKLKIISGGAIAASLTDKGDYGYNSTLKKLYYYDGSAVSEVPMSYRCVYKYNEVYYKYDGSGLVIDDELNATLYFLDDILLEQGSIDIAGNLIDSTTRVRTALYIRGNVKFILPTGFIVYRVFYYDENTLALSSYVSPNTTICEIGLTGYVAKVVFARDNTSQSLTPQDLKRNSTIEYINDKVDKLGDNIICLSVIGTSGVVAQLNIGEYGYNNYVKELYYKTGDNTYISVPLKDNVLYVHKGMYYHKKGNALVLDAELNGVSASPLVEFDYNSFDLEDFSTDLTGIDFNAKNVGNEWRTIYDQLSSRFDSLVSSYSDYVSKVDAAQFVSLSYPAYANLGGVASGNYRATPTYKTYMYKFINQESTSYPSFPYWKTKDVVLIFGALHGNELASPFNLYLLAKKLCEATDTNIAKLRGAYDIYMVPLLNGYGVYHADSYYSEGVTLGRVNANGVNINRNFPITNWAESGQGTYNYTGPSAGSEFETQLAVALINSINPLLVIDAHNYGATSPFQFYNGVYNIQFIPKDYQAYIDCCIAFTKNLPQYFGSFKKIQAWTSPYSVEDLSDGKLSAWATEQNKYGITIEISDCINYINGVINTGVNTTQFSNEVFGVGQFTFQRIMLRFCEWAQKNTILEYYN